MAKSRGNGEGSIVHRKDGRWMARLSHDGHRITVYASTKEEARKKLAKSRATEGFSASTTFMAFSSISTRQILSASYYSNDQ